MSSTVSPGAPSAPSLPAEVLQRRRIAARVSVSSSVADVLALHIFGPARDTIVVIAVEDGTIQAGGGAS